MLDKIESILFVASKPLAFEAIARAIGKNVADVGGAIETLKMKYNREESGIHLFVDGETVQMGTNPKNADAIRVFIKDEVAGELTKPQLETLTVIAYRSPITRPELEQIRGVNCAIILRNLLMRGLIEEKQDDGRLAMVYTLSFDALRQLGITSVEELPEYDNLHTHECLGRILESQPPPNIND
ncbi:MAG: SMC-Scp complex subunit ScpB [Patescibacteria group bacterium]